MPTNKTQPGCNPSNGRLITDEQRALDLRRQTYRERALKIHPWICAKCGREFTGKKLGELTFIIRIITTTTTHRMAVTGKCCEETSL